MKFIFPANPMKTIKIIIALFFISIGFQKLFSFSKFVVDVQNFNILPINFVLPFSILIVITEVLAGVALSLNICAKLFCILLISLMSIFTGAIIFNLLNGNVIECGCFGNTFSSEISWWSVVRNLFLGFVLYWFISKPVKKLN